MTETTCVTLGLAPSFGFGDRIAAVSRRFDLPVAVPGEQRQHQFALAWQVVDNEDSGHVKGDVWKRRMFLTLLFYQEGATSGARACRNCSISSSSLGNVSFTLSKLSTAAANSN